MTNAIAVPCSPADAPCGCGGDCGCSDPVGLERTRYFPRMLVGPDELTQDQRNVRDKLRRHNRLLHGWGVVCGADVTALLDVAGAPVPWMVCVDAGYVLGPFGDEIVVDCPTTFDVRRGTPGALGPCSPPADPWCSDVRVARPPERPLYLAIRYDEHLTRPVRSAAGCGCACDEAECEYSRIREGFALGILKELPASYKDAQPGEGFDRLHGALICGPSTRSGVRPCPPCPTDPWVVLAGIVADADGSLRIDPVTHRRYVASFGSYGFICAPSLGGGGLALPNIVEIKSKLAGQLDAKAMRMLDTDLEGDVTRIGGLRATMIRGVGASSAVGRFLGAKTLDDVAKQPREAFVEKAARAGIAEARATEIHAAAAAIVQTVRAEG